MKKNIFICAAFVIGLSFLSLPQKMFASSSYTNNEGYHVIINSYEYVVRYDTSGKIGSGVYCKKNGKITEPHVNLVVKYKGKQQANWHFVKDPATNCFVSYDSESKKCLNICGGKLRDQFKGIGLSTSVSKELGNDSKVQSIFKKIDMKPGYSIYEFIIPARLSYLVPSYFRGAGFVADSIPAMRSVASYSLSRIVSSSAVNTILTAIVTLILL